MRKKIGLVGVGSLGSSVAKALQDHADTIYAVDPDIVEERNLRNSIYTKSDINQPKVTALQKQISKCRFIPVKADIKDIELPAVDETIDCRDVLNRNIDTDVKFSIIGKNLRIDCEEVVFDSDRPGQYLIELEKEEVSQAGRLASDIAMSNDIKKLKHQKMSMHVPIKTRSLECLLKESEQPNLEIASCFENDINEVRDGNTILIRQVKTNYPQTMTFPHAVAFLRDALSSDCIYSVNLKDRCVDVYDLREYGGA